MYVIIENKALWVFVELFYQVKIIIIVMKFVKLGRLQNIISAALYQFRGIKFHGFLKNGMTDQFGYACARLILCGFVCRRIVLIKRAHSSRIFSIARYQEITCAYSWCIRFLIESKILSWIALQKEFSSPLRFTSFSGANSEICHKEDGFDSITFSANINRLKLFTIKHTFINFSSDSTTQLNFSLKIV